MKLGLITDIHEQVDLLEAALQRLRHERVDQIIVIGDIFECGARIQETCQLLADARAIGVWGNHDFGLCVDPLPETRAKYGDLVLNYAASLRPRLEVAGCLFQHVEPWLNAEDVSDLWYFEGPPETPEKVAAIFDAVPHRIMFAGHYHRWLLATPNGLTDWTGNVPVRLAEPERYFVVIGALCEGRFSVFDSETSELVPLNL